MSAQNGAKRTSALARISGQLSRGITESAPQFGSLMTIQAALDKGYVGYADGSA